MSLQENKIITIIWHIDDVLHIRPDLNKKQAREVLHYAADKHDAEFGLSWNILGSHAESFFPQTEGAAL